MTDYSPAAIAYAKREHPTHGTGCICVACENDCKAYAAGHAAALASVATVEPARVGLVECGDCGHRCEGATTEPVRLTDPDDPRIKPGARVRTCIDYVLAERSDGPIFGRHLRGIYPDETTYLLAEAPDPDDDEPILDALRVGGFVDAQLASLRAAGYDVVKRADA